MEPRTRQKSITFSQADERGSMHLYDMVTVSHLSNQTDMYSQYCPINTHKVCNILQALWVQEEAPL